MSKVKHRPMPAISPRDEARFWSKVEIKDSSTCWLWSGSRKRNGYGNVTVSRLTLSANRVAYFISTNIDPLDNQVCHSCDNPPCCNPAHLFLGTHKDNARDMVQKGRHRVDAAHRSILANRAMRKANSVSTIPPTDVRLIRNIWEAGVFSRKFIMQNFHMTGNFFETIIHQDLWSGVPMVPVELRKRKQGRKPARFRPVKAIIEPLC